jgi:hypothetical protein
MNDFTFPTVNEVTALMSPTLQDINEHFRMLNQKDYKLVSVIVENNLHMFYWIKPRFDYNDYP